MGPIPYGITWLLIPLKVLHNLPRPIGIFIPKSQGGRGNNNHNNVNNVNDGIKSKGVFMGPIPYGITWLLIPLKVLHNSPRPIGIFTPKSQGERG